MKKILCEFDCLFLVESRVSLFWTFFSIFCFQIHFVFHKYNQLIGGCYFLTIWHFKPEFSDVNLLVSKANGQVQRLSSDAKSVGGSIAMI